MSVVPTEPGQRDAREQRLAMVRDQLEEWMEAQPFDPLTEADDVAGRVHEMAATKEACVIIMGARGQSGFDYFLNAEPLGAEAAGIARTLGPRAR